MTLEQNKWKNLPLVLTVGRLFIAPLFFIGYSWHEALNIPLKVMPFILLFLMTLSEVSDFFDGYIARKFKVVTDLGKVLDPMCDSITRITLFLTFTLAPINLPLWLIFVFIYRDGIISTLRTVCALKGVALAARQSGKIKAIIQAVSIYIIIVMLMLYTWGLISSFDVAAHCFLYRRLRCYYYDFISARIFESELETYSLYSAYN